MPQAGRLEFSEFWALKLAQAQAQAVQCNSVSIRSGSAKILRACQGIAQAWECSSGKIAQLGHTWACSLDLHETWDMPGCVDWPCAYQTKHRRLVKLVQKWAQHAKLRVEVHDHHFSRTFLYSVLQDVTRHHYGCILETHSGYFLLACALDVWTTGV